MRSLFALLVLIAFSLPGCRPGEPESPLNITMRIGHSASVAGDRAEIHVLEADATNETARIGVACGDERIALTITQERTPEPVCGLQFQLDEVVGAQGAIRAINFAVFWGDDLEEVDESDARAVGDQAHEGHAPAVEDEADEGDAPTEGEEQGEPDAEAADEGGVAPEAPAPEPIDGDTVGADDADTQEGAQE